MGANLPLHPQKMNQLHIFRMAAFFNVCLTIIIKYSMTNQSGIAFTHVNGGLIENENNHARKTIHYRTTYRRNRP